MGAHTRELVYAAYTVAAVLVTAYVPRGPWRWACYDVLAVSGCSYIVWLATR